MYTVFTKANRSMPANQFNVSPENIICNDVILPRDIDKENGFNPHNVRMWIIGHTFGYSHCIFASNEQDALDESVDKNMMDWCLAEDQDAEYSDDLTHLGNAGELFDLSDVWMAEVDLKAERDIALILKLVRAQERGEDTLDF